MIALQYLPSFEDDAVAIWAYIAQRDQVAADRLIERLYQRCLILQEHPLAGPSRPDIAIDCRQLVVDPVLVLYRQQGARVDLVRALYRGRDATPEVFARAVED